MENPAPQPEEAPQASPRVCSALEWAETIVAAVALVAVVFTFLCRVITVDGISMEPTYHHGDRVLATQLAGEPRQGDVVIIIGALEEPIIKRVVATAGQIVGFDPEKGELTVDGEPLPGSAFGLENGVTFVPDYPGQVLEFPQTVPAGCVFVLGDNRQHSEDSRFREVGMVDTRNILGKVFFQLYPFSQFGFAG